MSRFILIGLITFVVGSVSTAPGAWGSDLEFFEKSVRPVLAENCFSCHGPGKQRGGLRLDHIEFVLGGGETGPALVPGEASESRILTAINYTDIDFQMPPDGKLADEAIAILTKWVALGAPWPEEPVPADDGQSDAFDVEQRRQAHWAWQPITNPPLPDVSNSDWVADPIDRFILAQLDGAALQPAPRAGSKALVRRASYDLLGLPPSGETLDEFAADPSSDAWEAIVDSFLESPRFGERWGRHWLDLVRYADSYGHEGDFPIELAWQYRDYVIRALNADVPYDQFVREHVAGDLLESPRMNPEEDYNEAVIGTGFWFLHQATHGPVDVLQDEADRIENQIDVFGKAFLGMTVACARCHDHKFDAITAEDYYALSGIIKSSRQGNAILDRNDAVRDAILSLGKSKASIKDDFQDHMAKVADGSVDLDTWIDGARDVLQGEWQQEDGPTSYRSDIVFSSFESETAPGWEEGTEEFVREYRGRVRRRAAKELQGVIGDFGIVRYGRQDPAHLKTKPFVIERNYIEFLLDGRGEEASVSLMVEGEAVLTASPSDADGFARVVWDVAEYEGREGRLVVSSTGEGRRNYLVVDYIVFSDVPALYEVRRPIESVAKMRGLDSEALENWIDVVPQRVLVSDSENPPASGDEEWLFFDGSDFGDWTATGQAFGDGPTQGGEVMVAEDAIHAVSAGAAHSGLDSRELRGVLRSPTFILNHDAIHYHASGAGARVRIVIAGYQIRLHNPILFEDTLSEVDTDNEYKWITHYNRLSSYRGQRAYLELMDEGDGYIAVDAIVFSNSKDPPAYPKSEGGEALVMTAREAARRYLDGASSSVDTDLLNVFIDGGLHTPGKSLTRRASKHFEAAEDVPAPRTVMAMIPGTPMNDRVHIRGAHKTLGDEVQRRFLEAITGADQAFPANTSGRLALANQMVSADNPLTARVFVNRVWQHLMGRGIVASVDNFGVLGDRPSHPALLEHLTWRFRESGWSTKALIKDILMSEAYRMSSMTANAVAEKKDPANVLLHRANLKRLEGEVIRDAVLAVSRSLNFDMYGPGVPVYTSKSEEEDLVNVDTKSNEGGVVDGGGRRSIYLKQRRNILPPIAKIFDLPTPDTTMGRRAVTNTPSQALMMMNNPFLRSQAERWAKALLGEEGSHEERIQNVYEVALSRSPNSAELAFAQTFFAEQGQLYDMSAEEARADAKVWADLCHVIFTLKEFIYIG
jgi:hypothetical protein